LAKELKRLPLPFCLAGAALPEGFEDAWELAVEDSSDLGSSDFVASSFDDASLCSGRLAGTVDSVVGFDGLAAGAFTAGAAAGGGGRAPVLR
jgi:hypothetical protein